MKQIASRPEQLKGLWRIDRHLEGLALVGAAAIVQRGRKASKGNTMSRPVYRLAATALSAAALVAAPSAFATWSFNPVIPNGAPSYTISGTPNLTVSGWYAASNSSDFVAKGLYNNSLGGIGVGADALVNNSAVTTDAVVLSFASSVVLNSVTIGTVADSSGKPYDSAFAVLEWAGGSSAPNMPATTTNNATSASGGWKLVGDYYAGSTTNAAGGVVIPATTGSSWWMISAFNMSYGGPDPITNTNTCNTAFDYFRLMAVSATCATGNCGSTNKTPEPASLALVAVALAGAIGGARRRTRRQPA